MRRAASRTARDGARTEAVPPSPRTTGRSPATARGLALRTRPPAPASAEVETAHRSPASGLRIGERGGPREREANRFAGELLRPGGGDAVRELRPGTPAPSRPAGPEMGGALQRDLHRAQGKGRPLPADTRRELQEGVPSGLGAVRIHDGPEAERLNLHLGSRAFTHGSDIYFREGFRPDTAPGRRLLAHELAHVVQGPADRIHCQHDSAAGIDRDWLMERIGFRMNLAFTKYVHAAAENERALRDAAADQVAMATLLIDVLFAVATPGLGRLLSGAVARAVATDASLATYRLALAAMDHSGEIVAAATAVGKAAAVDGLKAAVSRTEGEHFVESLIQSFSVSLDHIHGHLPDRTMEELAVLYANYDPQIATQAVYEDQIRTLVSRYSAWVQPIGESHMNANQAVIINDQNRAYWVHMRSGTYLAILKRTEVHPFGGTHLRFVTWVGDSMKDLALQKNQDVVGGAPETVEASDVTGIPDNDRESGRAPMAHT